jgi:hypothetical protein
VTCEVDGRFGGDRRRGRENDQKHGNDQKHAKDGAVDPSPARRISLVSASAFLSSTLT